jgi:phosphoglycolate phosphatase
MAYTSVIFDMDGTLLDTLEDLCISINHALALHGLPERERANTRRNLGNGMDYLVEHSVPQDTPPELVTQVGEDFRAHYALHASDHTRPYPGVLELLDTLEARGVRTAVVSNKGDFAVQELVRDLFAGRFGCAMGEHDGLARKPAPDMVYAAMRELGVSREGCVYVGDSEVDLATARNSQLPCISVSWGFRDRDELVEAGATTIVSSCDELLAAICA